MFKYVKIIAIVLLVSVAMYDVLVGFDDSSPTYRSGMLLGGVIFILVFPFLYEPFYRRKNKKSFVKLWFKTLFSE